MKQAGSKKSTARKTSSRPGGQNSSTSKKKPAAPPKKAAQAGAGKSTSKSTARPGADKAKKGEVPSRPPVVMKREPTAEEIQHKKNLAQFEVGLKLFNQGDFTKAQEIFQALSAVRSPELAQRALVYVNICKQRLSRPAPRLKTADDYYNYAVSMANQGNREEAENNLTKALKLDPNADYIVYALSTTQALRGNVEAALETLQKAIELNGKNRFLAQNDSDFESLGEDPRFTELLYPERPVS